MNGSGSKTPRTATPAPDPTPAPAPAIVDPAFCIRLRGVRQNNLKGFDLDLPLGQWIVVTGLSGSGKSSLAFDTLYAEGQRRYIETFSPYARQFFDRMDKPAVDRIENIPPAIAIEQCNSVRSTRSTVGTMTEICDHMKIVWPHIARPHCRQCGHTVHAEPPDRVWETVLQRVEAGQWSGDRTADALVTFELPLSEKMGLAEQFQLMTQQGFQRMVIDGKVLRLEEGLSAVKPGAGSVQIIADRLRLEPGQRNRFREACETAYRYGQGHLSVWSFQGSAAVSPQPFSQRLHCAGCNLDAPEAKPALFSFNHPLGACPACKGFGRIISIDPTLAIPDTSKSIEGGVVKPWQTGMGMECQNDMMRKVRSAGIPTRVPFREMSEDQQRWVMDGESDYDPKDPEKSWPNKWYGVRGYFRWLESKAYKMHVRVLLSRYRSYQTCSECQGRRLRPEALAFRWTPPGQSRSLDLAGFYGLPIREALGLLEVAAQTLNLPSKDPIGLVFGEVRARLAYLESVGLGYLTVDRTTRTLSGGETARVNLTTCLGTRLVNTLYVLDEPSVGLHPRDSQRLIRVLQTLRDAGNTVVVVEHEPEVMRAADQIVDIGPGQGAQGGHVLFQGSPRALQSVVGSLTGDYLSGRRSVGESCQRPVPLPHIGVVKGTAKGPSRSAMPESARANFGVLREALPTIRYPATIPALVIRHATAHCLKDLTVTVPLGRLVGVSGVSGSGKTTLIREILLPLLQARLNADESTTSLEEEVDSESIGEAQSALQLAELEGAEHLGAVVLVDQSLLGRTPRSNPAVYIGAFDDIRDFYAASPEALANEMPSGCFSFNSKRGQCETCRGAGFEKIEMQFLSDVLIRCAACGGCRYQARVAAVKVAPPDGLGLSALSISDFLDATVEEAVRFLSAFPDSKYARRALMKFSLLTEVGLGYLRLGQPLNTLSGGESQRLKLVSHLAATPAAASPTPSAPVTPPVSRRRAESGPAVGSGAMGGFKPTLFLFDEPTTGLHLEDVRILLMVFQRLVDQGHSVVLIEHHMELLRCVDWLIDLGPESGDQGGQIMAAGPPDHVASVPESRTAPFLRA